MAGKKQSGAQAEPKPESKSDLRDVILAAAAAAGEAEGEAGIAAYLQRQALESPSAFLALLGKALAKQSPALPPPVQRIELVAAEPQKPKEPKEPQAE